ncbi:hypothetical protein [Bacillus sp. Brlt_9]|uniref:hypothetical protein n=1 Tax=Bacillus sp. Brlt_9 TaxID=3110916 RepID=UPI003F7CD1CD
MEQNKYTFNEKELEGFLNDTDTANTFEMLFTKENHKVSESVRIMKMYDPSREYALVYNVEYLRLDELASIQRHQRLNYIGIFYKNVNCLVLENTYYYKKMVGTNQSLRVLTEDDVYGSVHTKVNLNLLNRKEILLNKFPYEEKAVQSKLEDRKLEIYRSAILGLEVSNFEIHPTTFERFHSLEMVQRYLTEGDRYIEEFVDSYIESNENTVRHFCLYEYAIREYGSKLKEDLYVLKAKRIHRLLKEELSKAKSIWVVKKDGVKVKVSNNLPIDIEKVYLGDASMKVNIDDAIAIEYIRKSYEIN